MNPPGPNQARSYVFADMEAEIVWINRQGKIMSVGKYRHGTDGFSALITAVRRMFSTVEAHDSESLPCQECGVGKTKEWSDLRSMVAMEKPS